MIAIDGLAVLLVIAGLALILLGLGVAFDRLQYALPGWLDRWDSWRRTRRHRAGHR